MIDAVFISDLHLHPDEPLIIERFEKFLRWAATHTQTVFILGDFFHAWSGDDCMDNWSRGIAEKLAFLAAQGVKVFYLHGNRDFLLGAKFATQACLQIISDPYGIEFNGQRVMLTHGDQWCTKDTAHQQFRKMTRNRWFPKAFLMLPRQLRQKLVNQVRTISSQKGPIAMYAQGIDSNTMLQASDTFPASVIIHGHIHQPGMHVFEYQGQKIQQYVLSDWDDNPSILCYDSSDGFYFILLGDT